MLQIRRIRVRFELTGQQFTGLVRLAALVQQIDLRHHGLEVVRVQAGDLFQRRLSFIQLAFVQVQAGELTLGLRVVRAGLEVAFELVDHLLQRSEVQALFIWRQAEQGVGRSKAHALLLVIEQWPQQQRALGTGHEADDALDRCFAHQR